MKLKFPKLQGFLVKPTKADSPKKKDEAKLNVSTAFVYKGHIVAINAHTTLFIHVKEYLKYSVNIEEDENPQEVFGTINSLAEALDGRTLSKGFFEIFSKMQKIVGVDEDRIYVEKDGLHSEYLLEPEYDIDLLDGYLEKVRAQWMVNRSAQGDMGITGGVYSSIGDVLKSEIGNDSLVFSRTTDDRMKFALLQKDWIFGVTKYDTESESSITKFGEANDFFELQF